jgi:HSP20 family protein
MSMVKWSPMKELEEMRRDMERIFDELFEPRRRRRWWPPAAGEKGVIVPAVDMYDRKTEIVIKTELPGVEKENIDLSITKDAITIKGEIKKDEEAADEAYFARERAFGAFARTIALPAEVDSEKAKASFKNGVLEIVLPKKEEATPKEIKVNIAG